MTLCFKVCSSLFYGKLFERPSYVENFKYDCNVISAFKKISSVQITNQNNNAALPQSCHQRLMYSAVLHCSHTATGYHLAVPRERDWLHLLKVPHQTSQAQPVINQ